MPKRPSTIQAYLHRFLFGTGDRTGPLLSKMYVKLKLPFNIQARESAAGAG